MSDIDANDEVGAGLKLPTLAHILRQLRRDAPPMDRDLFRRRITNATLLYLNVLRSPGMAEYRWQKRGKAS